MSTTTTNLGLTKPANNENVDLSVINGNYDLIDTFAGSVPTSVPDGLADLTSDVQISSPINGQALLYDTSSSKWKNGTLPSVIDELENLTDVSISSATDGQLLGYDANSDKWKNVNVSGGTNVVANPSGASTGNLQKLQVGNEIYVIPDNSWVKGDYYYIFSFTSGNGGSLTATEYSVSGGTATQTDTGTVSYAGSMSGQGNTKNFTYMRIIIDGNESLPTYKVISLTDKLQYNEMNYSTNELLWSAQFISTESLSNQRVDLMVESGGGGTTVVANPSGTATGSLNSIQIGSDIYSVSGGGSASWTDVTGTLTAGQTSITLSDASITANSTIDVYTDADVDYNSVSVSAGSITITFDAQSSNLGVKVRIS